MLGEEKQKRGDTMEGDSVMVVGKIGDMILNLEDSGEPDTFPKKLFNVSES